MNKTLFTCRALQSNLPNIAQCKYLHLQGKQATNTSKNSFASNQWQWTQWLWSSMMGHDIHFPHIFRFKSFNVCILSGTAKAHYVSSLCSTVTKFCFMLHARKHFVWNAKWTSKNGTEQFPTVNLLSIKSKGSHFQREKHLTSFPIKHALSHIGCWKVHSSLGLFFQVNCKTKMLKHFLQYFMDKTNVLFCLKKKSH